MGNLGESTALKIKGKLKKGTERILIDGDLLNHLKEDLSKDDPSFFNKKLIMIEENNKLHLVSTKLSDNLTYHCIIALTYMLEHEKKNIKIFGGGRIKFEDGKFVIYDKSDSFGQMDKKKVSNIMSNLNERFKVSNTHSDTVRYNGQLYSYAEIIDETHEVLS